MKCPGSQGPVPWAEDTLLRMEPPQGGSRAGRAPSSSPSDPTPSSLWVSPDPKVLLSPSPPHSRRGALSSHCGAPSWVSASLSLSSCISATTRESNSPLPDWGGGVLQRERPGFGAPTPWAGGEGTTRRGTATPVHRPQRPAGSTHSSTRGLRPPEQLERPAGFPSSVSNCLIVTTKGVRSC